MYVICVLFSSFNATVEILVIQRMQVIYLFIYLLPETSWILDKSCTCCSNKMNKNDDYGKPP